MNISKKYRNIVSFLVIALVLVSCNEKADQTNNYRDLNKNGRLDTYEDSAASVEERIDDLLGLMNLEEKAGMLFNAISGIDMGENMGRVDSLITKVMINHLDMPGAPSAKDLLEINNSMQKIAEGTRLGIPITFYSDPRHSIRFSESAGEKRYHTRWPSELGFGAIGDADIVREFGDISRQEYTAVGIRLALHPMAEFGNGTTLVQNLYHLWGRCRLERQTDQGVHFRLPRRKFRQRKCAVHDQTLSRWWPAKGWLGCSF